MSCKCFIVPPHLLKAIADSAHNSEDTRNAAQKCVQFHEKLTDARRERFTALTQPRGARGEAPALRSAPFIPEALLHQLSTAEDVDEVTRTRAKRDLEHVQLLMAPPKCLFLSQRSCSKCGTLTESGIAAEEGTESPMKPKKSPKDAPYRAVYNAGHAESEEQLPGKLERAEGQPKSKDKAVNEAYNNVGAVLDFYKENFRWKSIDNKNSGNIPARCSFEQFADVTVDCAEEEFGKDAAKTVRKAWTDVGVARRI